MTFEAKHIVTEKIYIQHSALENVGKKSKWHVSVMQAWSFLINSYIGIKCIVLFSDQMCSSKMTDVILLIVTIG